MDKKKVVLVIRDGWGHREVLESNAPLVGKTDFTDSLLSKYPSCLIETSGNDVGLPKGFMGGSEVGHLTIGAGRVVWQQLELINRSLRDESFFVNEELLKAVNYAKKEGKAIHILGLLSDKGVHSHIDHLFGLLLALKKVDFPKDMVFVHVFGDGRDSPRDSLVGYLDSLYSKFDELGIGVLGSVIGRFYGMDRDTRFDRTKKAYDLLVHGKGAFFEDGRVGVKKSYEEGVFDEFLEPMVIGDFKGVFGGDVLLCFNYRTDRVRQLFRALSHVGFDGFKTLDLGLYLVGMTKYYDDFKGSFLFDLSVPKNMLGEVVSGAGLSQLRISETEKYPHVTFFFNGQVEDAFEGESRVLIPSPRDVLTYDLKPEMSVFEIKDALISEFDKDYDLVVVNLVNGDMVGHTGNMDAAVKAVESVDLALKEIVEVGILKGYDFLIFADHGNCEEMSGEHQTSHTLNPVDLILVSSNKELQKSHVYLKKGGLKDIAPTALYLLGLSVPKEMTGEVLVKKKGFFSRFFS